MKKIGKVHYKRHLITLCDEIPEVGDSYRAYEIISAKLLGYQQEDQKAYGIYEVSYGEETDETSVGWWENIAVEVDESIEE